MKTPAGGTIVSFILIRIIMSLFPFIKEAFFGYKEKKKTTSQIVMILSLVVLVMLFFLQADVIKNLYQKNKELSKLLDTSEEVIEELGLSYQYLEESKNLEISSMSGIITTQALILSNCTSIGQTEEKNKESP